MAGTLLISEATFGDVTQIVTECVKNCHTYVVSDRIIALFNAWRFSLEPDDFVAGLIADAMDEEDGVEKDDAWRALSSWMRGVFAGEERYVRGDSAWHRHFRELNPPAPA